MYKNILCKLLVLLNLVIFSNSANCINIQNLEISNKSASKNLYRQHALAFHNDVKLDSALKNQILFNGSGVTAFDYDNDGLVDIFYGGLESENKLFKNLGNLNFVEATPHNLKLKDFYCTAVLAVDINSDKWIDLIIGTIGNGLIVLENINGKQFKKRDLINNIPDSCSIYSMAVADIDNDGKLDIYISTNRSNTIRNNNDILFSFGIDNGRRIIEYAIDAKSKNKFSGDRFYIKDNGQINETGKNDYILFNREKLDIVESKLFFDHKDLGDESEYNWGLGCIFGDLNNDYNNDLYVCNDLEGQDYIYIKNKNGLYKNARHLLNNKTPYFSMGVDIADINNDGYNDIFICDMLNYSLNRRYEQIVKYPLIKSKDNPPYLSIENNRNMLFLGSKSSYFDEIAYLSNLESSDWSWCPIYIDMDLDGYQDLFITNGFAYDFESITLDEKLRKRGNNRINYLASMSNGNFNKKYIRNESNKAFRNKGDMTFRVRDDFGLGFKGITHGACLSDLDNDGDEEIILNNYSLYNNISGERNRFSESRALFYENTSNKPRIRISFDFEGNNTNGVGAVAKLFQDGIVQTKQIRLGSRYCSSDEAGITFAYKLNSNLNKLKVFYNSKYFIIDNVLPNKHYILHNHDFKVLYSNISPTEKLFKKSELIDIAHDPISRDNLVINKNISKDLFQNEPIMAIIEKNRSSEPLITYQNNNSIFIPSGNSFDNNENLDQYGILYDFFHVNTGNSVLTFELRNNLTAELYPNATILVKEYRDHTKDFKLLNTLEIKGFYKIFKWLPSFNKEEIIIVLCGGPKINSYPFGYDTYSLSFNCISNKFNIDKTKIITRRLQINDAHIVDYDSNGSYTLIIAPEAHELLSFKITNGKFNREQNRFGLNNKIGFWNSINSGDINGDGKIDFIFGNDTENSRYKKLLQNGFGIAYNPRVPNPIGYECYKNNSKWFLNYTLNEFKKINPEIADKFASNNSFINTEISGIFGIKHEILKINELQNKLIMSNETGYNEIMLDSRYQFSPIYGSSIRDFNCDGFMDMYLIQGTHLYRNEREPSYNHSGIFYMQNKNGRFEFLKGIENGIENNNFSIRNLISEDLNGDNKPDLLLGVFGGLYKRYLNTSNGKSIKLLLEGSDIIKYAIKANIIYEDGTIGPSLFYNPNGNFRSANSSRLLFGINDKIPEIINVVQQGKNYQINISEGITEYRFNSDGF